MTETAKWYEKAGNCGDVVISTRVRLARNLKQYPFPARATDKQREAVEQKVALGERLGGGGRVLGGAPHRQPGVHL